MARIAMGKERLWPALTYDQAKKNGDRRQDIGESYDAEVHILFLDVSTKFVPFPCYLCSAGLLGQPLQTDGRSLLPASVLRYLLRLPTCSFPDIGKQRRNPYSGILNSAFIRHIILVVTNNFHFLPLMLKGTLSVEVHEDTITSSVRREPLRPPL